jgi:cell division protein FtsB
VRLQTERWRSHNPAGPTKLQISDYTYVMKQRPTAHWLGNAIGIFLAVYLCVSLGSTIKKNYDLDHQVTAMQQQITRLESQRQQLTFQLQYYQTSSYQEREAKSKLGLVVPGESEIVLTTPTPAPAAKDQTASKSRKSNFQQWLHFLGGNSSS